MVPGPFGVVVDTLVKRSFLKFKKSRNALNKLDFSIVCTYAQEVNIIFIMHGNVARILSLYQRANTRTVAAGRARRYCLVPPTPQLELTPTCVRRIKELEQQRQSIVVLRVTVDGGGCSGFQYGFQLENWNKTPQPDTLNNEDDILFENDGAFVIIDNISLAYVSGSKVDYAKELISSSFRVTENPNSESSCGCGVSFSPKQ